MEATPSAAVTRDTGEGEWQTVPDKRLKRHHEAMDGQDEGPPPPAPAAATTQPAQAATKPGKSQIKPLYTIVDATHNYPAIYRALKGSLQDKFTVYNRGRDQLQIQTASVPEYQTAIRALKAIGAQFSVLLQKDEIPGSPQGDPNRIRAATPSQSAAGAAARTALPTARTGAIGNMFAAQTAKGSMQQTTGAARCTRLSRAATSHRKHDASESDSRSSTCAKIGVLQQRRKHRPSHKAPQASDQTTRDSNPGPPEPPRHRPWGPPAPPHLGQYFPQTAQNRFAPLAQEPTYRETEWPVYANDYRPRRQHHGQPVPHFKKHPSGHKNGKGASRQPRNTPAPPAPQTPAKTRNEPQKAPPAQPQQASPAPADTMAVDATPGTSMAPQPTPAPTPKQPVLEDFLQVLEKSETFKSDPNLAATIMPMCQLMAIWCNPQTELPDKIQATMGFVKLVTARLNGSK
ncbi:proteoglycan 4-like [Bacillus rossius redtenbacheri]|uniref:proteoglycan 4-like n=1 Tax=Bacillus rossius redtenbacheri TaxID=93214 RepID=UPI002FDE147D